MNVVHGIFFLGGGGEFASMMLAWEALMATIIRSHGLLPSKFVCHSTDENFECIQQGIEGMTILTLNHGNKTKKANDTIQKIMTDRERSSERPHYMASHEKIDREEEEEDGMQQQHL